MESNDSKKIMNCHEFNKLNSRNDDSMANHHTKENFLAMTESVWIATPSLTACLAMTSRERFHAKATLCPPTVFARKSVRTDEAIHIKNKSARSAIPFLAPLRGAEKERKGSSSASALFMQEAESSEDPPLKALPKAYEQSEVKKRSCFSFGFRLTSAVGKACRGAGQVLKYVGSPFAKKCDFVTCKNESRISADKRAENAESLKDSSNSAESCDFKF